MFSFDSSESHKCKHRKIPYSIPDYSEYKSEYASLFDSVAWNRFNSCICGKMPRSFNSQIRYDKYTSVLIEPVFVNFKSCDGIYSQRVFGRLSPLYRNRMYPHDFFIIKGKEFIDIINLDSLKISSILYDGNEFKDLFTGQELDSISNIIKYGRLWVYESELAPILIKDYDKVLYNDLNENKQCLDLISDIFNRFVEAKESTDSKLNQEVVTNCLRQLKKLSKKEDLNLIINCWMYYDPTDFPSRHLMVELLLNSRPESINALKERIENKKSWEKEGSAPYSELKDLLKVLEEK